MSDQRPEPQSHKTPHVEKLELGTLSKVPRGHSLPECVTCPKCKNEIAVFARIEHFDCPHCGQKLYHPKPQIIGLPPAPPPSAT